MLKEILSVSGKPGLYKLISKGSNLLVIESLSDKKRIPAYTRDKVISLGDVSIFTDENEAPIGEVLTKIKEKEECKKISFDYAKADTDKLRAYLAEVLPNFDRERVYPTDIKKLLKWYDLLIDAEITDFSKKEEEEATVDEVKEENESSGEDKEAQKTTTSKTSQVKTTAQGKRKDSSTTSIKPLRATATKPMPKSGPPKKSVVGAKRGS